MEKEKVSQRPTHPDFAYRLWFRHYNHKDIDDQIAIILHEKVNACAGGNLKKTRNALLLSSGEMAKRNGILKRSYLKLEESDAAGTIKIETLNTLAESMGCELIYFLRPKSRLRYSRVIWDQLVPEAEKNGMYQAATGGRKNRALYGSAKRVFANPGFARAKKWTQRRLRVGYSEE